MFTKIATILALMATLTTPTAEQSVYMRGMTVTSVNYGTDVVTCTDAAGFEWEFYGCEDYAENDILCVLLSDNGTQDTILDDVILEVDYSGYWWE